MKHTSGLLDVVIQFSGFTTILMGNLEFFLVSLGGCTFLGEGPFSYNGSMSRHNGGSASAASISQSAFYRFFVSALMEIQFSGFSSTIPFVLLLHLLYKETKHLIVPMHCGEKRSL